MENESDNKKHNRKRNQSQISGKENAAENPAVDAAKTARTIVPRSEYDAALRSFNLRANQEFEKVNSPNNSSSSSKCAHANIPARLDVIQRTKEVLMDACRREVQPMDDHQFEEQFIIYDTPMKKLIGCHHPSSTMSSSNIAEKKENKEEEEEDDVNGGDENDSNDDSISISSDSSYISESSSSSAFSDGNSDDDDTISLSSRESDIDEEDLLDGQLYANVRQLRLQARQVSHETIMARQEMMEMSLSRIRDQLRKWQELDEAFAKEMDNHCGRDDVSVMTSRQIQVTQMEESLSNLVKFLKSSGEERIPDQISSLRETIESIAHSLHKHRDKKQNEDDDTMDFISGTERAIFTRLSPLRRKTGSARDDGAVLDNGSDESPVRKLDAATRFADFVSSFGS